MSACATQASIPIGLQTLCFSTNVCGNVEREYLREEIDSQLKTGFISALQPALAKISELQIKPTPCLPMRKNFAAMNRILTKSGLRSGGFLLSLWP
ncbi:hypothetical protein [Streptococcus sp.]|uniref:hypothetical protein n=1 Tax=Streptococcus sp. TaxID=1306 RepID=UPI00391B72B7